MLRGQGSASHREVGDDLNCTLPAISLSQDSEKIPRKAIKLIKTLAEISDSMKEAREAIKAFQFHGLKGMRDATGVRQIESILVVVVADDV